MHICFGCEAIIHQRPSGYSFLPELAACPCRQVSVETAQLHLDCAVLSSLGGEQIMVGAIDLSDMTVESPATVVERIRRALRYVRPEDVIIAPDCGMKYLPREVAFRQDEGDGRGGADPEEGIRCVTGRGGDRPTATARGAGSRSGLRGVRLAAPQVMGRDARVRSVRRPSRSS